MSHVHLDAVGGVAGDMFVAAMLDALPDLKERVLGDVAAILPKGYAAALGEGTSAGMAVNRFKLQRPNLENHGQPHIHDPAVPDDVHAHHHVHEHHAEHGAEGKDHSHAPATGYPAIVARIDEAALHQGTAEQAIAILRYLAQAESRMHGVPVEEVHFHEIADWDSVMDVVAAGSIAAALPGAAWSVSDLPLGHGLVRTRHGLLPVPAPATADILKGFRWRDDGVAGERVTPTGAAILAHLVADRSRRSGAGRLHASGTGAGTRNLPGLPNILRALVFGADADQAGQAEEIVVLSFDVDDMTGEEIGVAADHLRGHDGVLDLTIGSRHGKKGRPVAAFRLLVRPERRDTLIERCFLETSTIGLRWRSEQRRCLKRAGETVEGEGRTLRRKRTLLPDGKATLKVESDDIDPLEGLAARRRAKQQGEAE